MRRRTVPITFFSLAAVFGLTVYGLLRSAVILDSSESDPAQRVHTTQNSEDYSTAATVKSGGAAKSNQDTRNDDLLSRIDAVATTQQATADVQIDWALALRDAPGIEIDNTAEFRAALSRGLQFEIYPEESHSAPRDDLMSLAEELLFPISYLMATGERDELTALLERRSMNTHLVESLLSKRDLVPAGPWRKVLADRSRARFFSTDDQNLPTELKNPLVENTVATLDGDSRQAMELTMHFTRSDGRQNRIALLFVEDQFGYIALRGSEQPMVSGDTLEIPVTEESLAHVPSEMRDRINPRTPLQLRFRDEVSP